MADALVLQEPRPLTAAEIKGQVQRIQEVMAAVMEKDVHYGTIPGCGDKPALFKPGAEKLMMTFRLAADPQVIEIPTDDGITFRVVCRITNQATGVFLGSGIGECSSKEEKYNWRKAVCDEEFDETPADRRRGKWSKGYGDKPAYQTKQVRTNPADVANTVLKMAKKRALVDAILTVTAASDIFEQDLEEMDPELVQRGENGTGKKQPPKQPQSKSQGQGGTQAASADAITEGQKKLIYAKSKAKGIKEDDIKKAFGVAHITDLKKNQVNDVVAFIDNGELPGGATADADPAGCPKDAGQCSDTQWSNDMQVLCGLKGSQPCPYSRA